MYTESLNHLTIFFFLMTFYFNKMHSIFNILFKKKKKKLKHDCYILKVN
jgi:hypothetical protein